MIEIKILKYLSIHVRLPTYLSFVAYLAEIILCDSIFQPEIYNSLMIEISFLNLAVMVKIQLLNLTVMMSMRLIKVNKVQTFQNQIQQDVPIAEVVNLELLVLMKK